jgi:small subunit ribosomal protein S3
MLFTLRRVMEAGALGCEIVISGKLRGERASFEKLRAGKVYKAGEIVDHIVDRAVAHALLKPGVYGVEVIIVRPTTQLPDQIAMRELPPTEIDKIKEEVKGLLEAE